MLRLRACWTSASDDKAFSFRCFYRVVNWIVSYISGCTQAVKCSGSVSAEADINAMCKGLGIYQEYEWCTHSVRYECFDVRW